MSAVRPNPCPICQKTLSPAETTGAHFPFCSRRCREIDFFRWSEGRYALVGPLQPHHLEGELLDHESDDEGYSTRD